MFYTSSNGRIELNITLRDARAGSHPGPCDADIAALRAVPYIRRQLARIDPAALRAELREFGAWDTEELADHSANIARILWIACGDIAEEHASRARGE